MALSGRRIIRLGGEKKVDAEYEDEDGVWMGEGEDVDDEAPPGKSWNMGAFPHVLDTRNFTLTTESVAGTMMEQMGIQYVSLRTLAMKRC